MTNPHRTHSIPLAIGLVLLGLSLAACGGGGGGDSAHGLASSPRTRTFGATVSISWNELLYAEVKAQGVNPPTASRLFAYTGITLYESVVHGMPDRRSLQGQLNGLASGSIPEPADARHHWPTVANRALALVAASLLPPASATAIDALEAAVLATHSTTEDADVLDRSIDYGERVATAILAWAALDGFADACVFTPPVAPVDGGFSAVPGSSGDGLLPCWGRLRTFVVADGLECAPVAPPAYSTDPTSAFYAEALVVYNTVGDAGSNLTTEQADIARYWSDSATETGTPPGHWVAITCQMCDMLVLNLERAAQHFAGVGLAMGDAFITCWNAKYQHYLMRPVTYVQAHIGTLGDPDWDPLFATPNFPSFPSGHATQSAAVATVLMAQIGLVPFTDTTHSRLNASSGLPSDRTFASFDDAASEASASRLFGGIHFAFDNQDGYESGVCVGNVINAYVHFLAN